jgi:hypothetical protein
MTDEAKAKPDEAQANPENFILKVVIDRIEDSIATIVFYEDDSVHFNLPDKFLPAGTKGGDHFQLVFKKDKESRDAEKKKADDLLKELLGQSVDKKK